MDERLDDDTAAQHRKELWTDEDQRLAEQAMRRDAADQAYDAAIDAARQAYAAADRDDAHARELLRDVS